MLRYFFERCCSSISTKPRGLHSSGTAATASTPLKAGITIEYLKGSLCSFFTEPSSLCSATVIVPASTPTIFALVIQLTCLAELGLHEPLAVAHAAQAHVADVGLGRDVGHRHAVADLATAQVRVEDHRGLVRGPVEARTLRRADDDRARVLHEPLVRVRRRARARACTPTACAPWAEPRHFLERELRPGRDHQVVVRERAAARPAGASSPARRSTRPSAAPSGCPCWPASCARSTRVCGAVRQRP